jgi:hypothetical protein
MNDRIHFHEIHADSFECYRKFHACLLCLLKFFFSGFEDSEHILTPSALYVGLGAGSKAQQFAQMMAIGRKKGVPNKTTALKDTILKAAECAVGIPEARRLTPAGFSLVFNIEQPLRYAGG